MDNQPKYRYILMLLALITLTTSTWAGLIRLGWKIPAFQPALPISHGPLMIAGFFGTLISLERAVAMGKTWTYIGPALNGFGGILLAFGVPGVISPVLLTLGSLWLVFIFIVILRDHRVDYMIVMALGAISLLIGNLLWTFGGQVNQIVLWWAGFLILTIAGERLELGRLVQKPKYSLPLFYGFTALFLGGLFILQFNWDLGVRVNSLAILGLAVWLLRFDIARKTIKQSGLTRFIAVCLLSGYFWLIAAGIIGAIYGAVPAGPIYDTFLHSIFLGFVFAMIFGHAPIIFPAVLGLDINYKSRFYIPLFLLHLSLLIRTVGEMSGLSWSRLWGGLFNILAVLLYLGMIAPIRKLKPRS